eukprot:gene1155-1261_t
MAQHFLQGRLSAFVEDAEHTLSLSSPVETKNIPLQINLAAALYELGLYRRCLKICEKVVAVSPHSLQAYKVLGKAFLALSRKAEAIQAWENALEALDISNCDMLLAREIFDMLSAEKGKSVDVASPPIQPSAITANAGASSAVSVIVVGSGSGSSDIAGSVGATAKSVVNAAVTMAVTGKDPSAMKQVKPAAPIVASPAAQVDQRSETASSSAKKVSNGDSPAASQPFSSSPPTSTPATATNTSAVNANNTVTAKVVSSKDGAGNAVVVGPQPSSTSSSTLAGGKDLEDLIQSVQSFPEDNKVVITFSRPSGEGSSTNPNGADSSTPTPTVVLADPAAVKQFYREMKRTADNNVMCAPLISAMKTSLPHLTHCSDVDNLIALAYLEMNSTKYDRALTILEFVLKHAPQAASAWIGRGSLYAIQRKLQDAVKDFTTALQIDKTIVEAWKRRGVTRGAISAGKEAIADLTRAVKLQPQDSDSYYQRGLIHHQMHNYNEALRDYEESRRLGYQEPTLHNLIGQIRGSMGQIEQAIASHKVALEMEKDSKETLVNLALMYKESGNLEEAVYAIDRCLELFNNPLSKDTPGSTAMYDNGSGVAAKSIPFLHVQKASVFYQMGRIGQALAAGLQGVSSLYSLHAASSDNTNPSKTLTDSQSILSPRSANHNLLVSISSQRIKAELITALQRVAWCYASLGIYNKAVSCFDQILSLYRYDSSAYQRQVTLALWEHLDHPCYLYNLDNIVDPTNKEGWCKGLYYSPEEEKPKAVTRGKGNSQSDVNKASKPQIAVCRLETDEIDIASLQKALLEGIMTELLASISFLKEKWEAIQCNGFCCKVLTVRAVGFPRSRRQERVFGLIVLNMVAALRHHLGLLHRRGSMAGMQVSDETSSVDREEGMEVASSSGSHSSRSRQKRAAAGGGAGGMVTVKNSAIARGLSDTIPSSTSASTHLLGWRDVMDIAARWKQISEPSKCVFFIDRMPNRSLRNGSGYAQTVLQSGNFVSVRCFDYFKPVIDLIRCCLGVSHHTISLGNKSDSPYRKALDDVVHAHDHFPSKGYFFTISEPKVDHEGSMKMHTKKKVSKEQIETLGKAQSLQDLMDVVGEGFYVVVPYFSVINTFPLVFKRVCQAIRDGGGSLATSPCQPKETEEDREQEEEEEEEEEVDDAPSIASEVVLEGARVILSPVTQGLGGWDFVKRTPSTHQRFIAFSRQLDYTFSIVESCLQEVLELSDASNLPLPPTSSSSSSSSTSTSDQQPIPLTALPKPLLRLTIAGLYFYYVWIVFSPLSRSSSTCGLAILQSILLVHGGYCVAPLPQGIQLEWEAALCTNVHSFILRALDIVQLLPISPSQLSEMRKCEQLLEDERNGRLTTTLSAFRTVKDMLHGLALPYPQEA